MKQQFQGIDNDVITVEYEPTIVSADNLAEALKDTKIDLRPDQLESECKVYFAVVLDGEDTGTRRLGTIKCKGKTLLALCREAVDVFVKKAWGLEVEPLDPKPIFDCKMSSYMVIVHQSVTGQPAGDVDFLPLDDVDFMGLLNISTSVGYMVEAATQDDPEVKGYAIALPMFEGRMFWGAPIPEGCTAGMFVKDEEEKKKEGSKWGIPLAIIAGVAVVGGGWWLLSSKPVRQAPRAVR